MLKSKIRKKILNLRKLKNSKNIKLQFSTLFNILKKNNLKNKFIGGYYPFNYEIDDLDILKELEKKNIKISLPVINKNNKMDFYQWSFKDSLNLNKYGIPEPERKKLVYPDIILVPLVAFDKRLYRLGYGGGFYDRYIEKLLKKKSFFTIGLALSCQKISRVPNNKYDKKIDIIMTEKYILK
ncbi:MAG: 5-formyltetrahydrofolate cyclo-ligase [Candidatus Pelagibacter bacterium]|nr:5-formyltetrahydrofolate cyclo-ligase [Candidatus Pelagibacter bacterium]